VLAADSTFRSGRVLRPRFRSPSHQLPNAFAIENSKRILLDDSIPRGRWSESCSQSRAKKPKGVCVRFVSYQRRRTALPLAISSATRAGAAATRSLCERGTRPCIPFCEDFFRYPVLTISAWFTISFSVATRGIITRDRPAAVLGNGNGRLEDGAHLHLVISG